MAGCVPCFVIPLLLFIFHRYIQPILLKFWNPWENKSVKNSSEEDNKKCEFSCDCKWMKKKEIQEEPKNKTENAEKIKAS